MKRSKLRFGFLFVTFAAATLDLTASPTAHAQDCNGQSGIYTGELFGRIEWEDSATPAPAGERYVTITIRGELATRLSGTDPLIEEWTVNQFSMINATRIDPNTGNSLDLQATFGDCGFTRATWELNEKNGNTRSGRIRFGGALCGNIAPIPLLVSGAGLMAIRFHRRRCSA